MDTGLEKATFSRPPLFRGERYRIRRYMYTDTKTETGVGHDRSRPCAGQWRFTPVVRVGCHGNPSPYTWHVKARIHVRVTLTLGFRQARGG